MNMIYRGYPHRDTLPVVKRDQGRALVYRGIPHDGLPTPRHPMLLESYERRFRGVRF